MQLAHLVATAADVAATRARSEKTRRLAGLLRTATPDEVATVVGILAGEPRQGRVGVGWATARDITPGTATTASLTVADLDRLLDRVAAVHGPGTTAERQRLLDGFTHRATPAESDFLARLLIGELRQGASAGVVTDAVAKATGVPATVLRRAVMLSGDLGAAAEIAAREGRAGLERVRLRLHRPVQPMLASTAPSVADAIGALGTAAVEWKLDGIRIQAHRLDGDVRVWTRNLNEITDAVPDVVAAVRELPGHGLVLDGEVLGSAPHFFDLLHHDGDDLLDTPLAERRERLALVAGDCTIPGILTDDPAAAERILADALAHGHEGVVIKAADSPYQAGRRGRTWRKVKPVHTLDLVVLAVEHGSGRRRGRLSNIHLGARGPGGGFVMVGKTFKGMTDEMLRWQTDRFRELAVDDDGRVVTVRPEQVVEVAVDGIQRSTRYPGGVALRFARVLRYRADKTAGEADTIDTVRSCGTMAP